MDASAGSMAYFTTYIYFQNVFDSTRTTAAPVKWSQPSTTRQTASLHEADNWTE